MRSFIPLTIVCSMPLSSFIELVLIHPYITCFPQARNKYLRFSILGTGHSIIHNINTHLYKTLKKHHWLAKKVQHGSMIE